MRLLLKFLFLPVALAACATVPGPQGKSLPAEFRNELVIVRPVATNGETIEFYTDTGGGFNAIGESVAERLALQPGQPIAGNDGDMPTVHFPEFQQEHDIPAPAAYFAEGRLAVVPDDALPQDGFLGGRWFADKVWEFDYPACTLRLLERAENGPGMHSVELGFQLDADGKRTTHFPRIPVEIDGETLQLLLDTGAQSRLTAEAATHFGVEAGAVVGSGFISQSVFQRWVENNPDWLVVEEGEAHGARTAAMIRVPGFRIAGLDAGPAWFAVRPDRNFDEFMSSMMDEPVQGALGGSALKHFRVVIDYPGSRAWFSK